jgi:hypothetical protein
MHAQWDMAWLIWLAITIILAVICWGVAVAAGVVALRSKGEHGVGVGIIAVICALVIGAIGTWVSLPWSGQYHRFVPEAGVVAKTGSRFLASDTSGGGSTQKYVITFRDGRSYGVLDTRAANVEVGDRATFMCERVFQLNAPSEGYDCNWGRDVKPDGSVIP